LQIGGAQFRRHNRQIVRQPRWRYQTALVYAVVYQPLPVTRINTGRLQQVAEVLV
jgi:hypothetical protein